ncbi:MAG: D-alanyl-D-alanine carboxypeptidase/D-alanyl-D-alanine-endopeptidase [Candidatus Nanopelagicales bacterium]
MKGRTAVAFATVAGLMLTVPMVAPSLAQDEETVVLEPVAKDTGQVQDPALVAAAVAAPATSKKMGKQSGTLIIDAESGDTLYDNGGATPLIPASTNKIPTSVAVLHFAGPNRTLQTTVTRNGNDVFLIGGGDPLLSSRPDQATPGDPVYPRSTSMPKLAADTAAALKGQGTVKIALKVDDSYFDGPAWGPGWPPDYKVPGIVAPVSALIVNDGKIGKWGPITDDPALQAGRVFAELLKARGISVTGVARGRSGDGAQELASIDSAPIYELVSEALTHSDNQTAENLFRVAGKFAGTGASFTGGGQAVDKALDDLGISTLMTEFKDGSGLSRENRLTPNILTDILRRTVRAEDGLWPIASGLSVAGVTGTLQGRFTSLDTSSASGWLRGKTGTLNYVSSLAGFVQSRSGRVLAFASIGNDSKSAFETAATIDKIMTAAAACGCPGTTGR